MEEYTFTPIDIVIHWYIRLRSRIISRRDNRALYKQFSTELHLDKMKKEDISYALPKSYLIVTNEIKQLYNVRDEILVKMHHNSYMNKQISIDHKIEELKKELVVLKEHSIIEKSDRDKLRVKLKGTKDNSNYIALEARISQADARLTNTKAAIKNDEVTIDKLNYIKKLNYDNWEKQIKLVEKAVDDAIIGYIKRSTKKIELNYGFTDFTYELINYDDSMKKIVRGEY